MRDDRRRGVDGAVVTLRRAKHDRTVNREGQAARPCRATRLRSAL